MATTKDQVKALQDLDFCVGNDQREQLRLCLYLPEAEIESDKDVENAKHLSEFLEILERRYHKNEALLILLLLLKLVGVHEYKKLGVSEEKLRACLEKKNIAYLCLVVSVCRDLRDDNFDKLKSNLCSTVLRCTPANITSRVSLLLKLHNEEKISSKDLKLLVDELNRIGRNDIASRVKLFVKTGKFELRSADTVSLRHSPFGSPVEETTIQAGRSDLQYNTGTGIIDRQGGDSSHPLLHVVSDNERTGDCRSGEHSERPDQLQSNDDTPGTIDPFVSTETGPEQDPTCEINIRGYRKPEIEVDAPPGKLPSNSTSRVDTLDSSESAPLIENSTENDKPDLKSTLKKQCQQMVACIVLIVVCFILTLVVSIFTAWFVHYYATVNTPTTEPIYAAGGETVIAAEVTDKFALLWNSISECHQSPDDYPHSNQLYIVSNQLRRHSRPESINYTKPFNQTDAYCGSKSSILPDPLYMLKGSSINFSVCVSANSEPGPDEHGLFVIFDGNKAYKEYTTGGDCLHPDGAACVHNLNIGRPGHFLCTPVSYKMTTNGHLYALPVIPGGAQYYYRYSFDQFYLNEDDFGDRKCTFSSNGNNVCVIGFVSPAPAYLVVHIVTNSVANSQSTHLCYRSDWSYGLIAMVVLLGVTAGVSLIAVIALSVCLHRACRKYKTTKSQLPEHAAHIHMQV